MNTSLGELFYRPFDAEETWILGKRVVGDEGFVQHYLYDGMLSFLFVIDKNVGGEVRVMNTVTGETKVAYEYERKQGEPVVNFTLLNDKYVFWAYQGRIMSRHLETGKVRTLAGEACDDLCATPKGLICFDTPNRFIDQETGEMTPIDYGGALQVDGTCSHERDEIVWIDYRDPPGTGSDYFGPRNGGEVYVKHLLSGELTRLTHDSPDNPRGQGIPGDR